MILFSVHVVLHPHGIAPTFIKLDLWSPGAGFIPIISTKVINQIKKGKLEEKKSFMHTKRFNTFFKRWVQFHIYYCLDDLIFILQKYNLSMPLSVTCVSNGYKLSWYSHLNVFV